MEMRVLTCYLVTNLKRRFNKEIIICPSYRQLQQPRQLPQMTPCVANYYPRLLQRERTGKDSGIHGCGRRLVMAQTHTHVHVCVYFMSHVFDTPETMHCRLL